MSKETINYDLHFYGEVNYDDKNEDLKEIKNTIAVTLGISEKDKVSFFSGKKITIKEKISYEEVTSLKNKLEKIRMKTHVVENKIFENDLLKEEIANIRNKIPSNLESFLFKYVFSRESNRHDLKRTKPHFFSLFKGWKGRMNRVQYFLISPIALFIFGFSSVWGASSIVWALGTWGMISLVRFTILRVHDIGLTGWVALLLLVPYINIVFILSLFLIPGVIGSNRFGRMS